MCGVFAAIGDLTFTHNKFINDMFIMDSLRGPDSCGLLTVKKDLKGTHTVKSAIAAHDFIDLKKYDKALTGSNAVAMGHNRWATKGGVTARNAHPFTIGNITGVHNGTLTGQYRLPDYLDYDVDSENIMHSIDKIGIEQTWGKLDGAATLMWWNSADKTFNIIRNDDRPLFFAYSKSLRHMFAASEKFMLLAALDRNNISVHRVETLPVDTLYTFKIDLATKDAKEVVKCTTKKLKPFVAQYPARSGNFNRSGYNDWWNNGQGVAKGDSKVVPFKKKTQYKLREKVDFQVQKIEYFHNFNRLSLSDNLTDEHFMMEDYRKDSTLKVGDCATAKVQMIKDGVAVLNAFTTKNDSGWVESEADKTKSKEINDNAWLDEEGDKALEGEVLEAEQPCRWCKEPVGLKPMKTTAGEVFCSQCADLMDVKSMVDFAEDAEYAEQSLYRGAI